MKKKIQKKTTPNVGSEKLSERHVQVRSEQLATSKPEAAFKKKIVLENFAPVLVTENLLKKSVPLGYGHQPGRGPLDSVSL